MSTHQPGEKKHSSFGERMKWAFSYGMDVFAEQTVLFAEVQHTSFTARRPPIYENKKTLTNG